MLNTKRVIRYLSRGSHVHHL